MCKECFFAAFEDEIHQVIVSNRLFKPGERVAIGASGGKGEEKEFIQLFTLFLPIYLVFRLVCNFYYI